MSLPVSDSRALIVLDYSQATKPTFNNQNYRNVASFGGKAFLCVSNNNILNPSKRELKKVDQWQSIHATIAQEIGALEDIFCAPKKDLKRFYAHAVPAFVVRTAILNIALAILAPVGMVVNGLVTAWHFGGIVGRVTYSFLGGRKIADEQKPIIQDQWRKVNYYARGFFSDMSFTWMVAISSAFLAVGLCEFHIPCIALGLVGISLINDNKSVFSIMAPKEQCVGLFKAAYLREEFGLVNQKEQALLTDQKEDDEVVIYHNGDFYRQRSITIKGPFIDLYHSQAARVHREISRLAKQHFSLQHIRWTAPQVNSLTVNYFVNYIQWYLARINEFSDSKQFESIKKQLDVLLQIEELVVGAVNCREKYSRSNEYFVLKELNTPETLLKECDLSVADEENTTTAWQKKIILKRAEKNEAGNLIIKNDEEIGKLQHSSPIFQDYKDLRSLILTHRDLRGYLKGLASTGTGELRELFKKASLALHPDKVKKLELGLEEEAAALFILFNEAYQPALDEVASQ